MQDSSKDNIHPTGTVNSNVYTDAAKSVGPKSNFQLPTEKLKKINRLLNEDQMDTGQERQIPCPKPFFYQGMMVFNKTMKKQSHQSYKNM